MKLSLRSYGRLSAFGYICLVSALISCGFAKKNESSPADPAPKQTDGPSTSVPVDPAYSFAFVQIEDALLSRVMCDESGASCQESSRVKVELPKFFDAYSEKLGVASLTERRNGLTSSIAESKATLAALTKEQGEANEASAIITKINSDLITVNSAIADLRHQISLIDASLAVNSNQPTLVALRSSYQTDLESNVSKQDGLNTKKAKQKALIDRQGARDREVAEATAKRDTDLQKLTATTLDLTSKNSDLQAAKKSLPETISDQKVAVADLKGMLWFEEVFAEASKK